MTQDIVQIFDQEALNKAAQGDADAVMVMLGCAPDMSHLVDISDGQTPQLALARLLSDYFQEEDVLINDDVRMALIEALMPHGFKRASRMDFPRLSRLAEKVDIMVQLQKIDDVLDQYFFPKVAAEDVYINAREHWGQMSINEKVRYAQKFARDFALIAKIPEPIVVRETILPFITDSGEELVTNARCAEVEQGRVVLELNDFKHPDNKLFEDYRNFHETVVHELTHGIQIYQKYCAQNGFATDLGQGKARLGHVLNILLDDRFYRLATRAQHSYASYPIEVHAEKRARVFGRFISDAVALNTAAATYHARNNAARRLTTRSVIENRI